MTNLSLTLIKEFIDTQAKYHADGEPFTINYEEGLVSTKHKTWAILIDMEILRYIKLEEQ